MDSLEIKKWAYEQCLSRLKDQISRSDTLDAKVNRLLVVSCILLIPLGMFALQGNLVNAIPGFAFDGLAIVVFISDFRVRSLTIAPPIAFLKWHLESQSEMDLILDESITAIHDSYELNRKVEDRRASTINWGAFFLAVGIFGVIARYLFRVIIY